MADNTSRTMGATTDARTRRDALILDWHIETDPHGLKCPFCGAWSVLDFASPQGVRLTCRVCGVDAIMPRVPLARAIRRARLGRRP